MKLKVCGMKYRENIEDVATLQPDYLGFIFYEKSPRFFNGEISELPITTKKVGVFVNASLEEIIEKVKKYNLQVVQLHGNETTEFCEALRNAELDSASNKKNQKQVKIIKVFSIKGEFDFKRLVPYEAVCDYFLFDTKGELPGGNGYVFDWAVLKDYSSNKPYFLSGGIGVDEIKNINIFLKSKASKYCYAIDVNSKFEIKPGLKDVYKIREFRKNLSFRT